MRRSSGVIASVDTRSYATAYYYNNNNNITTVYRVNNIIADVEAVIKRNGSYQMLRAHVDDGNAHSRSSLHRPIRWSSGIVICGVLPFTAVRRQTASSRTSHQCQPQFARIINYNNKNIYKLLRIFYCRKMFASRLLNWPRIPLANKEIDVYLKTRENSKTRKISFKLRVVAVRYREKKKTYDTRALPCELWTDGKTYLFYFLFVYLLVYLPV